jgi:hypothetical protein
VEFHEAIDMGCEPVNTILNGRESVIHFFAECSKFKTDQIESPIDLPEPSIDLPEPSIDLPEPSIDLPEPPVYLLESPVDLLESPLGLSKSRSNKPFERRESLIDSSRFLCRILFCHSSN